MAVRTGCRNNDQVAVRRIRGETTGALLTLLALAETFIRDGLGEGTLPYGLLVCVFGTLPVAALRLSPAVAAAAVTAASVLSLQVLGTLTVAGLAAQLIVLHEAGRGGAHLRAALLTAPFVVLALVPGTGPAARVAAALAPAAAGAGIVRWARGQARRHSAAERTIGRAVLENTARGERARIARELHDVVAHHLSMIAVQAETARLATPGMPADGAERLLAIGDTARGALTEMRRLLGVLREDAETAERRPQPGLRQLNELLDQAREATGAGMRLIVRGPVTTLDPGVELTAYRIVQEALTNARRHAPGTAVDVELSYLPDALRICVRDLGPGPAAAVRPDAHGLLGMRERAATVGGSLRTGPAPGGGFLVEAVLPGRPR
jgi:signal transduction histidine kinase